MVVIVSLLFEMSVLLVQLQWIVLDDFVTGVKQLLDGKIFVKTLKPVEEGVCICATAIQTAEFLTSLVKLALKSNTHWLGVGSHDRVTAYSWELFPRDESKLYFHFGSLTIYFAPIFSG